MENREEYPSNKSLDKSLESERNLLAHERTRLASERTLLSWIRTGLAGVGIGVAVARFLVFQNPESRLLAKGIGQLLIIWGIAIFLFALFSYRHSYYQLGIRESYKSSLIGVILIISMLVILCSILFWIIL